MTDFFYRGGPLMYPILLCSAIGWAIFVERWIAYFRVARGLTPLSEKTARLVQQGALEQAAELCQQTAHPLARILAVVVKNAGRSRSDLKAMAEEVGEREAVALQHYLGLLGTIANISPLLGLLGTVLGMIKAFNVIALEGVGTPATLGGGISEAMITTATGLSVAVPMILLHRYLTGRSERLTLRLEVASMRIVDLLEKS